MTIASGGTGANSVSFGPRVYSDCGALQPENHSHTSARLPELRLDAEHTLSIHWSHRRSQPHGSRVSTLLVTLSLHEHIQALPRVSSDRIEILSEAIPAVPESLVFGNFGRQELNMLSNHLFAVKCTGTCESALLSVSIENRIVSPSIVPL